MSWEDEINQIEGDAPSTEVVKRGPGRPPGAKNGDRTGISSKPIVDWSPLHDRAVMLHVAMHRNSEIAEILGITQARVAQILNDPQGKRYIKEAQERLREKMSAQIEDGLVGLCMKALQNVRETIEIDGLAIGSDFKKHQDKLSMDLLHGRGFLPGSNVKEKIDRPPINEALAERLVEALEASNEVDKLVREEATKRKEIVVDEKKEAVETTFVLVDK